MASENMFLLYALIMGIFITFLYDIFRILRNVIPHNGFMVSLEDIGFWIYCAIKVFLLMYHESNGTLRWFAVLGALVGMFLYKRLVSPFFVKYASLSLSKIFTVIGKIFRFLFHPLLLVLGKCRNNAIRVSARISHKKSRIQWRIKKKLTLFIKLLKMNLRKKNRGTDYDEKKGCISQK